MRSVLRAAPRADGFFPSQGSFVPPGVLLKATHNIPPADAGKSAVLAEFSTSIAENSASTAHFARKHPSFFGNVNAATRNAHRIIAL